MEICPSPQGLLPDTLWVLSPTGQDHFHKAAYQASLLTRLWLAQQGFTSAAGLSSLLCIRMNLAEFHGENKIHLVMCQPEPSQETGAIEHFEQEGLL